MIARRARKHRLDAALPAGRRSGARRRPSCRPAPQDRRRRRSPPRPPRAQMMHAERPRLHSRQSRLDRLLVAGSTAWSIRPSTEWEITFQPWNRMLRQPGCAMTRIEDRIAGGQRQDEADQNADRGHDIRDDMLAVGRQRRRAMRLPTCISVRAQTALMQTGDQVDRQAEHRRIRQPRVGECCRGLAARSSVPPRRSARPR